MYNHYIRLGEGNVIVYAFSDAFEKPQELDVCVSRDTAERHHRLDLYGPDGGYRLRWNPSTQKIEERSQEEIESLADAKGRVKTWLLSRIESRMQETEPHVRRHVEQKAASLTTTITDTQFVTLVEKRETARAKAGAVLTAIDAASTHDELKTAVAGN